MFQSTSWGEILSCHMTCLGIIPIINSARFFNRTEMSPEDIAEDIHASFPGTEDIIVRYLSGYVVDDAGAEEDVLQVTRSILASLAGHNGGLDRFMQKLNDLLKDQLVARSKPVSSSKLVKLEQAVDTSKVTRSYTVAITEGVHLESINKGK
jgi:ATP-binding cassette subfamily F protein 3